MSSEKNSFFHLTTVKAEWFTSNEQRFRTRTLEKITQKKLLVKLCVGNVFLSYVLAKHNHPGHLLDISHFIPKASLTHS